MVQKSLQLDQAIRGDVGKLDAAAVIPLLSEDEFGPDDPGEDLDRLQKGVGGEKNLDPQGLADLELLPQKEHEPPLAGVFRQPPILIGGIEEGIFDGQVHGKAGSSSPLEIYEAVSGFLRGLLISHAGFHGEESGEGPGEPSGPPGGGEMERRLPGEAPRAARVIKNR